MAYDDRQEQYLVVWQEETSEIRGRWVLPSGTVLDSSDIDLSTTSHSYRYWPHPITAGMGDHTASCESGD